MTLQPAQFTRVQYRSGGIGHLPDDESRSVVGMVPVKAVARYREHLGDQNPDSERRVQRMAEDIKANGFHEPLMLEYDHRAKLGTLGEGNHRLAAAERLGLSHVPVRVYGRSRLEHRERQGALAGKPLAPLQMDTAFDALGEYVPPDVHPQHFRGLR